MPQRAPSPERTAQRIHRAFRDHEARFLALTALTAERFAERDWHGLQDQAAQRLDLYPQAVRLAAEEFASYVEHGREFWTAARESYADTAGQATNAELARTFFNSVTRRIFGTEGVDPETEFVEGPTELPATIDENTYFEHEVPESMREMVQRILSRHDLGAPYAQFERDAVQAGQRMVNWVRNLKSGPIERLQTLRAVFYRNKGAYIVGRMSIGNEWKPYVLPLTHGVRGVEIDAVLMDENENSILFSFARSYFHVITEQPRQIIAFLRSFMPHKPVAELYISLGFHKQGKAEQYRALEAHLANSVASFESAAVDKGMVMIVFGLADYEQVFKVIRDRFAYPKNVTRRDVLHKYELVFRHDRVGRLVDAQEFEHLRFRRDQFSKDLLDELMSEAGSTIENDGQMVTFDHLYAERRMTPLNVYLRESGREAAREALLDYGRAIKELAAVNIFPGDFLLKNFGVTRHGRVVFYDYDELCRLSDCRFRKMPVARHVEDDLSDEPWFGVRENDIFPEEFPRFLGIPERLRRTFDAYHGDLFRVEFWTDLQRRHRAGEVMDIFPYPARRRLRPKGL